MALNVENVDCSITLLSEFDAQTPSCVEFLTDDDNHAKITGKLGQWITVLMNSVISMWIL